MDILGQAIYTIGGLAVLASIVTIIIPLRRRGFMAKRLDGLRPSSPEAPFSPLVRS